MASISEIKYYGSNNNFDLYADNQYLFSWSTTRANPLADIVFAAPLSAEVIRFDLAGGADWAVVWEAQVFGSTAAPEPGAVSLVLLGAGLLFAAARK